MIDTYNCCCPQNNRSQSHAEIFCGVKSPKELILVKGPWTLSFIMIYWSAKGTNQSEQRDCQLLMLLLGGYLEAGGTTKSIFSSFLMFGWCKCVGSVFLAVLRGKYKLQCCALYISLATFWQSTMLITLLKLLALT